MDIFSGLISGFQVVCQPANFLYCFFGVLMGTLIGVLPGIGAPGAMAILLPFTFSLSPVSAIIMLAGIYYGVMYGGSTTSILLRIPGEAPSVITCLDGYEMAKKGRAGPALGISAFGSWIGGTFSVIALMILVYPLAKIVLKFGPPEYFSIIVLGMTLVIYLARGSILKAIIMALFGLLLSTVGIDLITGYPRFTFGSLTLMDGIGIVPLAMGFFGLSEVFENLEVPPGEGIVYETKIKNLLPNLDDWKRSIGPIIRGSVFGFFLGVLPGAGAIIPSFASYSIEKRISKHPEEYGKGAIEGVAGPETANNAGAGGAFVPLLAFGIPPNVSLALLLGAFMIHGVIPGPRLIIEHPLLFWGIIASMYVGNVMLVLLNLPLIGIWVKILKIPYRILMPLILLFCIIGAYSMNNNIFDVIIMVILGLLGYALRKFDYEEAPLVLAFILGPMLETNFRQSLLISDGDLSVFITHPIAAAALIVAILLYFSTALSYYRKAKQKEIE